jgi:hypothetical protein
VQLQTHVAGDFQDATAAGADSAAAASLIARFRGVALHALQPKAAAASSAETESDAVAKTLRAIVTPEWFSGLTAAAKLSYVRGVIITTPVSVLVASVAPFATPLLCDAAVIDAVLAGCKDGDDFARGYAMQTLETWLSTVDKCRGLWVSFARAQGTAVPAHLALPAAADAAAPPTSLLARATDVLLTKDTRTKVTNVILSNWEHTNRRVASLQPKLMDILIELTSAGAVADDSLPAATAAAGESSADGVSGNKKRFGTLGAQAALSGAAGDLIDHLLMGVPVDFVSRYPGIVRILPRAGAMYLLSRRPLLIEETLQAIWLIDALSPAPGTALNALLVSYRRELEEARGLLPGTSGGCASVWRRGTLNAVLVSDSMRTVLSRTLRDSGLRFLLEAHHVSLGLRTQAQFLAQFDATFAASGEKAVALRAALVEITCPEACDPLRHSRIDKSRTSAFAVEAELGARTKVAYADIVSLALASGALQLPSFADISASVVQEAAVEELLYSYVYGLWLQTWAFAVVDGLLHTSRNVRNRLSHYALRDLVLTDLESPAWLEFFLLTRSRKIASAHVQTSSIGVAPESDPEYSILRGDDGSTLRERRVWAGMYLGRLAQTNSGRYILHLGEDGTGSASNSNLLDESLVRAGVLHPDPDTKLLAMELVSNGSASVLPRAWELEVMLTWLQSDVRTNAGESRKRGAKSFQTLLQRCLDGLESTRKALAYFPEYVATMREKGPLAAANGAPKKERAFIISYMEATRIAESGAGVVVLDDLAATEKAWAAVQLFATSGFREVLTFLHQSVQCLADCIFPGCSFERMVLAFDLMLHAVQMIGIPASPTADLSAVTVQDGFSAALSPLVDSGYTQRLVNALICTWDRARFNALQILSLYPGAVPGFADAGSVTSLLEWALTLLSSARLHECEGAALVIRLMSRKYVRKLGWKIQFHPTLQVTVPTSVPASSAVVEDEAAVEFFVQTAFVLRRRTERFRVALFENFGHNHPALAPETLDEEKVQLQASEADQSDHYLPHGALLALRFLIEDVDLTSVAAREATASKGMVDKVCPLSLSDRSTWSWRRAVARVLRDARHILSLAMQIVAGTKENDGTKIGGPDTAATAAGKTADDMQALSTGRVDLPVNGKPASAETMFMPASNFVGKLAPQATKVQTVVDLHALGKNAQHNAAMPKATLGEEVFSALKPGVTDSQEGDAVALELADMADATATAGGDEEEEGGDGGYSVEDGKFTLIVGSWMSTKESCLLQGYLVSQLPLPNAVKTDKAGTETYVDDSRDPWLMSSDDITTCGYSLLDALLTLKHIGCIAGAADAFRAVATRLLLHGSNNPHLSSLPSSWLSALLVKTKAASQFILRRSAGFAQAFLALLRSEPSNLPPVLLYHCLTELLHFTGIEKNEFADDAVVDVTKPVTSKFSWRTHVHALNILRLIFKCAELSADIARYIPAAIRTAVSGFTSVAWAVRNSSMMLFAAALDRSVGTDNRNIREGARSSTTTTQFFARFPTLHTFIVSQLRKSLPDSTATGRPVLHPSLYPLLLLLSRLRPELLPSASEHMSIASFLPLIETAVGQRHAFVRRMAGRAWAALLPLTRNIETCLRVTSTLPLPTDKAFAKDTTASNKVHGSLLLVRALLSVVKVELQSTAGSINLPEWLSLPVFVRFGEQLSLRASMVQQKLWPGTVRAVMSDVLLLFSHCASMVEARAQSATSASATACSPEDMALLATYMQAMDPLKVALEVLARDTGALSLEVGEGLLRVSAGRVIAEAAVRLLLNNTDNSTGAKGLVATTSALSAREKGLSLLATALGPTASEELRVGASQQFKRCIKHADQYVQKSLGALKGSPQNALLFAFDLLQHTEEARCDGLSVCARMANVLADALVRETHPDTARYLAHSVALVLRILSSCLMDGITRKGLLAPKLSASLLFAHDQSRDTDARAHLLLALSEVMKVAFACQPDALAAEGIDIAALASAWAERAISGATNLRVYRLRLAAINAIARSGVLFAPLETRPEVVSKIITATALSVWTVVIASLQDFDDEVRDSARCAAVLAFENAAVRLPQAVQRVADAVLCVSPKLHAAVSRDAPGFVPPSPVVNAASVIAGQKDALHGGAPVMSDSAAVQLAFLCMTAIFQSDSSYLTWLVQGGFGLASAKADIASATALMQNGRPTLLCNPDELNRRTLFVEDPENNFFESSYQAQVAALHVLAMGELALLPSSGEARAACIDPLADFTASAAAARDGIPHNVGATLPLVSFFGGLSLNPMSNQAFAVAATARAVCNLLT